jgi:hypothetical protein
MLQGCAPGSGGEFHHRFWVSIVGAEPEKRYCPVFTAPAGCYDHFPIVRLRGDL